MKNNLNINPIISEKTMKFDKEYKFIVHQFETFITYEIQDENINLLLYMNSCFKSYADYSHSSIEFDNYENTALLTIYFKI